MKIKRGILAMLLALAVLLISGIVIGVVQKNESKYAVEEHQTQLANSEETLLPENTPETEPGTIVKTPDKWQTEVTDTTKVATVYAVAVGNGETVPVPYGFYYVGGNLETGAVISDDEDDKYNGTDRTDHTYSSQLQGNQFVWIPCEIGDYKKIDFGLTDADGWDISTNTAEETQIAKYGGFYVGRYEAGTSEIKGIDFTKAATATNWYLSGYEYTNVTSGNVTSKAGEIPYYHANYWTAVAMSEKMINTNYAHSGLMTGTMYDVMLHYMSDDKPEGTEVSTDATAYEDLKTTPWGNYYDTTLTGCTGQYCTVNRSNGSNSAWADNTTGRKEGSTSVMLTTGSTNQVKKRNIYDVAGNLWERTQESCYYSDTEIAAYVNRGGCHVNTSSNWPACFRSIVVAEGSSATLGFRVALYLK